MSGNCGICSTAINTRQKAIKCIGECQRFFHLKKSCINVEERDLIQYKTGALSWRCDSCTTIVGNSSIILDADQEIDTTEIKINCLDDLAPYLSLIIRNTSNLDKCFSDLQSANNILNQKLNAAEGSISSLQSRVNQLEGLTDNINYNKIKNNIIISGLPTSTVFTITDFKKIMNLLELPFNETSVKKISKINKKMDGSMIIIVELTEFNDKSTILNKKKTKKFFLKICIKQLSITMRSLYVNI